MPGAGLEPARPKRAGDFKSPVSTNSTTRAYREVFYSRDWHPTEVVLRALQLIKWRREPESNRPTWICNPVHNRFAIAPN